MDLHSQGEGIFNYYLTNHLIMNSASSSSPAPAYYMYVPLFTEGGINLD